MHPPFSICKTIKWGGLLVAVLLGSLWWISSDRGMGYDGRQGLVLIVAAGRINLGWREHPYPASFNPPGCFFAKLTEAKGNAWYDAAVYFPREPSASFTIGFAVCLALSAATGTHWFDVRAQKRHGLCRACGYDRAGLGVKTVCPECGKRA